MISQRYTSLVCYREKLIKLSSEQKTPKELKRLRANFSRLSGVYVRQ